jgi:alpha-L-arabinofuranosidase
MNKALVWVFLAFSTIANAASPDSVYLFSYSTTKNNNKNGLHFAWSRDREVWHGIGNEYAFLKSDYGRWDTEKRMIDPFLIEGNDGLWHCVWAVNEQDNVFAHAASADLVNWKRQSYNYVAPMVGCLRPVIDHFNGNYTVIYANAAGKYYNVSTHDFKSYTPSTQIASYAYANHNVIVRLPGGEAKGQLHRVPWAVVDKLIKAYETKKYRNARYAETAAGDAQRFAGLKELSATINLYPERARPISDMLLGVFFEDINYAADGGLYAELVENRDFEYTPDDRSGRDENWNARHSWNLRGEGTSFIIDSTMPLHPNNPHYAVLDVQKPGALLQNNGFDGIAVKKGEKYDFSVYTRQGNGGTGKFRVLLTGRNGKPLANAVVHFTGSAWKNAVATLTASDTDDSARLEIEPLIPGKFMLDMISLFPQKTFRNHKNGLRSDLAQAIADMHPRFIRFPGGCVAHGDGLGNIYRWKNTIGPLHERVPQRNLWGYHQTAGLGYFEYFRFCEDIGAAPLPVVAAGVPCQNSGTGGAGQQGGIPIWEMDEYVQEVLDLIEYANGDVNTKWGKKRAEAGHPKPFNLKYIGIGNEDMITDVFEERFKMIYEAVKEKHPEITVIGTVGPFYEGTDYDEGWDLANKLRVPMVDEHYYVPPSWFIYNQNFYDSYSRSGPKVYLGEYAAHLPGRPNNLETALAEALYLTSLERNGDVVSMASYAPLLAKEKHTQWNPDLIYFNNTEVKPTVGYEVQKLFGLYSGDQYIPLDLNFSNPEEGVRSRIAISCVRDSKNGSLIIKLVNMLPVQVKADLNLRGTAFEPDGATVTVLKGQPDDKDLQAVQAAFQPVDKLSVDLDPYSFKVIKIKLK